MKRMRTFIMIVFSLIIVMSMPLSAQAQSSTRSTGGFEVFMEAGDCRGNATLQGFEGQIVVNGFEQSIARPTDPSTGLLGTTVDRFIRIFKQQDTSSICLLQALLRNQFFPSIKLTFLDGTSRTIAASIKATDVQIRDTGLAEGTTTSGPIEEIVTFVLGGRLEVQVGTSRTCFDFNRNAPC